MKKLLQIAGVRVLAYIEQNIKSGKDYEGKSYHYSENPFYLPYNDKIVKKLGGSYGNGKLYNIVKNKKGKLGMIILGGYNSYKKEVFPQSYGSFLTQSGNMLKSMSVLKIGENEAIIGFTGNENIKKAYWLNVSGAGKSRKLWKFLGISKEQERNLIEDLKPEFSRFAINYLAKIVEKSPTFNN